MNTAESAECLLYTMLVLPPNPRCWQKEGGKASADAKPSPMAPLHMGRSNKSHLPAPHWARHSRNSSIIDQVLGQSRQAGRQSVSQPVHVSVCLSCLSSLFFLSCLLSVCPVLSYPILPCPACLPVPSVTCRRCVHVCHPVHMCVLLHACVSAFARVCVCSTRE